MTPEHNYIFVTALKKYFKSKGLQNFCVLQLNDISLNVFFVLVFKGVTCIAHKCRGFLTVSQLLVSPPRRMRIVQSGPHEKQLRAKSGLIKSRS